MTTPAKMKAMVAHLTQVPDQTLELFIEDAVSEVAGLPKVPADRVEKLTRYLAVHLATLSNKNVIKEKLDGLEKQYSDNKAEGLQSTPYGQEYQRMVDALDQKPKRGLNLTVI